MPEVRRGARRIHYTVEGEGVPLLLVPGLGSGARLFGTLPRRFSRDGYRCITFDPVGIEPSSPHVGPYDFDAAADDLLAVLAAAADDDAGPGFVVGTSLGGKVALAAAVRAPDRIRRLVLLAAAATRSPRSSRIYRCFEIFAARLPGEELAEVMSAFLFGASLHARRPELIADIVRGMKFPASTRELIVAQARALQDFDGAGLAAQLDCPCLCLAGTEDTLTSIDEVEATAALLSQGVFAAVPGAGHSLLLEAAAVYGQVTAFLPAAAG